MIRAALVSRPEVLDELKASSLDVADDVELLSARLGRGRSRMRRES